jgi:hypothetical protein
MRLLSGGCSRVEYQRIGGPVWSVACEYGASSFSFGKRGGAGKARAGCGGCCLAHCWVLRQQGRSFWGPVFGCFGFPACPGPGFVSVVFVPRGGFRAGGVTGLLFENYIVDASIL